MLGCPLRLHKCDVLFKDLLLYAEGTHELDHFVHYLLCLAKLGPPHGLGRNFGSPFLQLRYVICLLGYLARLEFFNNSKLV